MEDNLINKVVNEALVDDNGNAGRVLAERLGIDEQSRVASFIKFVAHDKDVSMSSAIQIIAHNSILLKALSILEEAEQ